MSLKFGGWNLHGSLVWHFLPGILLFRPDLGSFNATVYEITRLFKKRTKGVRQLRFPPNFAFFSAYFCNFFMIYTFKIDFRPEMPDFFIPVRFGFLQHQSIWDNSIFFLKAKLIRKLLFLKKVEWKKFKKSWFSQKLGSGLSNNILQTSSFVPKSQNRSAKIKKIEWKEKQIHSLIIIFTKKNIIPSFCWSWVIFVLIAISLEIFCDDIYKQC